MAIMVTGGLGVIGSWVTRNLVERGIKVVTYDYTVDTFLIKDIVKDVNCVTGDVLDFPRLISTIKNNKIERIIHMAALMIPPMEANPYMTYRINVDGTMNILEAARVMDVRRVVYISSQGVYDMARGVYAFPEAKPMDEDYPKAPPTVYGATKLFMENMCSNYNRIYGIDFVTVRFGLTYGPGKQARHGAVAINSTMIESGMLGKSLRIPAGGDQIIDMVYHPDAANGVVLACLAETPKHRFFNISSGKGETLRHLAEVINSIVGKAWIEIGPGLNPLGTKDPNYLVLSIDRAREELGYLPKYGLEASVRDYIQTMRRLEITPTVVAL
jgi:UDP-glucose 4-epimerase